MLSLRPIYCELLPQGFLLIENNGKLNTDVVATPAYSTAKFEENESRVSSNSVAAWTHLERIKPHFALRVTKQLNKAWNCTSLDCWIFSLCRYRDPSKRE